MAEKLKENEGAFWKGLDGLVSFLLEKEHEARVLPRSNGDKSEVKLFDYIKNIRKGNTFVKFKPSKVKKAKIDGKMVRLDRPTSMEILEEVLYKLVPKEQDKRRLWRNCKKIRERLKPHDIFMTPIPLAVKHIRLVDYKRRDVWCDPFRGTGNYYKNFPVPIPQRRWCEINENKDFFQFEEEIDIICSNPPYSLLDKVLEKSIALKPRIISFIIGHISFTAKRMSYMEQNNYRLKKVCYVQVKKWLGNSVIVVYELEEKGEKTFVEYHYDEVKYG
jgi:hypothetical protein